MPMLRYLTTLATVLVLRAAAATACCAATRMNSGNRRRRMSQLAGAMSSRYQGWRMMAGPVVSM
ncbi:MAG: hypothetical protein NTU53_18400 [Planctomycetota bacterium]|nr:hypothetical protein [Planctomycetota bacterium]